MLNPKLKLLVRLLVMVLVCNKSVFSLKCFQCFMAEHPYFVQENSAVKTCEKFDLTDDFVQDCPESTFCFKRSVKGYYYKREFVREERGCAKQAYHGQKYDDGTGWTEDSYIVGDAYKNDCKMVENYGLRSINMEECYCDSGDLCNSSDRVKSLGFYWLMVGWGTIKLLVI